MRRPFDYYLQRRFGLFLFFAPPLRLKREFSWTELSAISLNWQGDTKFSVTDHLDLFFSNGGYARIPLNKLFKKDLEELILALSLWGGNRSDEQHLKFLQTSLRDEAVGSKRLSIFDLWEQELADKFSEISFRPLAIDASLQNGRYKIIKQLGFGGFSATYLSQFNERELVVLKESVDHSNKDSNNGSARKLLQEEASILAQMRHPQIVKLIDHFVENERQYLAIEYIAGPSLRQLVRENGPQSESQVTQWTISICDILHYLHSQSPAIIHLDLTPENLLLSRNGQLKLIDFGSSLEYTGKKIDIVLGKENYMPPEQVNLNPHPQSDIFTLGATIYFMLTGQDPPSTVMISPRSCNSQITVEFDNLIRECTAIDISARIQSAQTLKKHLLNIMKTKYNPKINNNTNKK